MIIAFIIVAIVFCSYYSAAGRRNARKSHGSLSAKEYQRQYKAATGVTHTGRGFKR